MEEVTGAYIDLANNMNESVEGLQKHLDTIAEKLKQNASNTEQADDAMAEMFKGGK